MSLQAGQQLSNAHLMQKKKKKKTGMIITEEQIVLESCVKN